VPAAPQDVYKALTTETTIRLCTGDLVQIDPREGGEFPIWDDAIQGRLVTLEPCNRIVQQRYFGDQEKPSLVTIKLHEHKKGTSFELHHSNIPDEAFDDIVEGWNNAYMASLIEFYEEE